MIGSLRSMRSRRRKREQHDDRPQSPPGTVVEFTCVGMKRRRPARQRVGAAPGNGNRFGDSLEFADGVAIVDAQQTIHRKRIDVLTDEADCSITQNDLSATRMETVDVPLVVAVDRALSIRPGSK